MFKMFKKLQSKNYVIDTNNYKVKFSEFINDL